MKKIQNNLKYALMGILLCMVILPNVKAASGTEQVSTWNGLKTCLEGETNEICELNGEITDIGSDNDHIVIKTKHTLALKNFKIGNDTTNYFYFIVQDGADFKITSDGSGKIVNKGTSGTYASTIFVYGNNVDTTKLNVGENVTIEGLIPVNVDYSGNSTNNVEVVVDGYLLNNTTKSGIAVNALNVNGRITTGNVVIKVTEKGKLESTVGAGMYQAGLATTTIEGEVKGKSGIVVKSGTINLDGATVTADGAYFAGSSVGSGFTATGAAIQIDSYDTYAGNVKININDSELSSEKGDVIQEYGTANHLDDIKMTGNVTLTPGTDDQTTKHSVLATADDNFTVTANGSDVKENLTNNQETYKVTKPTPSTGSTTSVDKTKLDEAIVSAEKELEKSENYTAKTISALKTALAKAKEVSNNTIASQTEVDEVLENLNKAIKGLELVKDGTPKTGNTDLMGITSMITLLSLVGIVTLKKSM